MKTISTIRKASFSIAFILIALTVASCTIYPGKTSGERRLWRVPSTF